MKKMMSLLLVGAMVFGLCACGSSEPAETPAEEATEEVAEEAVDPVVWKISCVDVEGSDYMNAFTAMWEKISEATDGYIQPELYYANSLGNETEVLEGMQLGTIQAGQMATSVLANFSEYFYVNDLPFLFEDFAHCERFMETEAAQKMVKSLEEDGFCTWYWGVLGYKQPNLNKACITSLDDCKGLKWRVMDTTVQVKTVECLGANPVTIAYDEVYSALGNNTIDVWMNDAVAFKNLSTPEVAPYLTEVPLFTSMQTCIISKAAYDALPEEYQQIVYDVFMEEWPQTLKIAQGQNKEIEDTLKAEGFKEYYTVEDVTPFFEAVQPVYEWMESEYPSTAEIIDAINEVR